MKELSVQFSFANLFSRELTQAHDRTANTFDACVQLGTALGD